MSEHSFCLLCHTLLSRLEHIRLSSAEFTWPPLPASCCVAADPSPVDNNTFLWFRGLELTALRPPRHLSLCVSFPRTLTCLTRCPVEPLPSLWSISTRDTTSLHTSSEPLPSDHAPEALPAPAVTLTNAPASFHPGDSQRMTFLTSFKSSTCTNNLGFLALATVPTATPRSPPWSHSHCCPRRSHGSSSHDSLARPPRGPPSTWRARRPPLPVTALALSLQETSQAPSSSKPRSLLSPASWA